jgi:hypothetical protein
MARVSWKAVFVGVLVDFALSTGLAIVAIYVWGYVRASSGRPVAPAETATSLLVVTLVIGLFTLALGGFVAGRIAKRGYLLHGLLVGAGSLAIGLVLSSGGDPRWFTVTGTALDIPAAAVGALFAKPRPVTDVMPSGNAAF